MIHLEEVTPDNWRKVNSLKVSKEQERFVASNVGILARAYAYRNEGGKALIIYNDNEMVGLVFYREWDNCYILDQFMIDSRFQGKGYSKAALDFILRIMKEEGKYSRVELCYCKGNEAALNLFKGFGFCHRHDEIEDGDEVVMELNL